jgi:hypothetical protein
MGRTLRRPLVLALRWRHLLGRPLRLVLMILVLTLRRAGLLIALLLVWIWGGRALPLWLIRIRRRGTLALWAALPTLVLLWGALRLILVLRRAALALIRVLVWRTLPPTTTPTTVRLIRIRCRRTLTLRGIHRPVLLLGGLALRRARLELLLRRGLLPTTLLGRVLVLRRAGLRELAGCWSRPALHVLRRAALWRPVHGRSLALRRLLGWIRVLLAGLALGLLTILVLGLLAKLVLGRLMNLVVLRLVTGLVDRRGRGGRGLRRRIAGADVLRGRGLLDHRRWSGGRTRRGLGGLVFERRRARDAGRALAGLAGWLATGSLAGGGLGRARTLVGATLVALAAWAGGHRKGESCWSGLWNGRVSGVGIPGNRPVQAGFWRLIVVGARGRYNTGNCRSLGVSVRNRVPQAVSAALPATPPPLVLEHPWPAAVLKSILARSSAIWA